MALVGLLNKQPAKFAKLLPVIRGGVPELNAIEEVYGWDEEELTRQWHAYVMGQGNQDAPTRVKPKAAAVESDKQSAEGGTKPHEGNGEAGAGRGR